jgi:RHS repeat-associated protein
VSGLCNRAYAQVVKEINATTGNVTDYLYGDDLIKQTRAANDSYYLYDGLGSTRALSDSAGAITDTYNYESFGSVLNQTGTTPNNYLFTGEQFDNNLDNYYLRARYYDQNVGRFTQQDTWMGRKHNPITLHKYLYANANPATYVDPTGNFSLVSFSAANSVRSILNDLTVDVGLSLLDGATSDGSSSDGSVSDDILLVGASMLAIGGGIKIFKLLSKKKVDKNNKLLKGSIKLNERAIKKALASSSLRTQQTRVSIPRIERFVEDMLNGSKFPPIKVDGNVIVDGHHRYIAAKIANKQIDVIGGTRPLFQQGEATKSLTKLIFDTTDY